MLKCNNWPISICSWSLQKDIAEVAEVMRKLDVGYVHLAVRAGMEENGQEYLKFVRKQDWTISCTMIDFPHEDYTSLETIKVTGGITPDEHWDENYRLALGAIDITADLGVKYLSTHIGFIDHTKPDYTKKFYDRVRLIADAAAAKQITFLLETGQETALDLKKFLEDLNHPAIQVNFDPANLILYEKGNPIEAIKILAPWLKHVHIKDALRTETPGTWGTEVPWGQGQVDDTAFLNTLKEIGFDGALAIEREAGDDRFGDIKKAAERLITFKG